MDKEFTLKELEQYDGQDGRPAYVAIDGTVYDLSAVDAWHEGKHHGNVAGHDLSQAILKSPHLKSVLPKLPIVGKLI
jgi:predicted heme/steroid binding protein